MTFDRETKVCSEMEASSGTKKKRLWERIEGINETEGREKIEKKSILEWQQTGTGALWWGKPALNGPT